MKINEKGMSIIKSKMEAFSKAQKLDYFNDLESLKRDAAEQGTLQSGGTIKKGCKILSNYLESRESYLIKTINDMPLKFEKNISRDLRSISEKYIPVDFNDFRGNYLKLLEMAAGPNMRSYNAGLEIAEVENGKVMERCNLEIDQLCHTLEKCKEFEGHGLIATEIVMLSITTFLCGLWVSNPEGNYEPWIILTGVVTAVMEIVRRFRAKNA